MKTQDHIRSSPVSRLAALAETGTKVGVNYLKHYGRQAIAGRSDKMALDEANAKDIYQTFSKLKGGPLKVAQMLSIDQNMLPTAYAREFSQAQYSAPPLSYPLVVRTFIREFGQEPSKIFDSFSKEAVSGASIGQVHRAKRGQHSFAVKVQYPGVADSLKSDLAIVKSLALSVMGLKDKDVDAYFREIEERLMEETNYELELKRSMELSRRSSQLRHIFFPRYYPEFSSRKILTMDWVDGVTLDKFADGPASQDARNQVGQALWDFYQHQVHTLRVFHADPHPGNFLIKNHELGVIDFGCTKQLDPTFYRHHFAFLNPEILEDPSKLVRAMESVNILLPTDSRKERESLINMCHRSVALLARPIHRHHFDFGDPSYMQEIYEMGEDNHRSGGGFQSMRGARGSAHSLYVNRTYYGLYSLLARLKARVQTHAPIPELV